MRAVEKPPILLNNFDLGEIDLDLQSLGRYEETQQIEDQDYPYWDKWKYRAKDWGYDPVKLWAFVKSRRSNYKAIRFQGPDGLRLLLNTPSTLQRHLHQFDLNLGGSIYTNELIPEEEKHRYLVSSLMEEAIASSQLEGAATTRRIAKEMLENNRKPRNSSEQMIVNNYEIMQWIVRHKGEEITPARVLEIHRIITNKTLLGPVEEGALRTSDDVHIVDVQTGAILHTPPSYVHLDKLMEEFCIFANDQRKDDFFLHPIIKAIALHFLIGFIHPFVDGNGRTARALFYWYLIKKGYWLIEYLSISRIILGSKAQYARAYQHTELDENDLTYFLLYNLKAMGTALEELKKYVNRKKKEKNDALDLFRHTDYNERQITLLQDILADQKSMLTVTGVETRFQVSNQTARNDLNGLAKSGILEARKSGKKTVFLLAKDALEKIKGA